MYVTEDEVELFFVAEGDGDFFTHNLSLAA